MKRISKEEQFSEFVKKSIEKFGDIFNFDISGFINLDEIHFECKNGHKLKRTNLTHLRSKGCQHCIERMTQEEFLEEAKKIHGNKFDYSLVQYVNRRHKVEIICNDCGDHILQAPFNHLLGNACRKCSRIKPHTNESFIELARAKHGDKYGYDEIEYITSAHHKIKIWCKKCQKFIYQTPQKHLYGGCMTCGGREQLTQEKFLERCKNIHGDRYDYSKSVYVNMSTKVIIKCNSCDREFSMSAKHHVTRGQGCKYCIRSRGETRIEKFLDDNNIIYKPQKSFTDCRNIKPLPFDFCVYDENGNVKFLIEYQGEQHYGQARFKGLTQEQAEINFVSCKKRDKIKHTYCKVNNIRLLQIKYTHFDSIEKILVNFMKKLN